MPRQDTRLESEGAEFLVLGNLLIEGIAAYKTYTNMPGYDLIATSPENSSSTRIQVKSRWRTNAPGFLINKFNCDFVVLCLLNRGNKNGRSIIKAPEFFVFPSTILEGIPRTKDWGKIRLKDIPNLESYREKWGLIKAFLNNTNS